MRIRLVAFCNATVSLGLGLAVYWLFREKTFLHLPFCGVGVFSGVSFLGDTWLRYYFPDFLWGYALTMGLYILYPPRSGKRSIGPATAAALTGMAYELLQLAGVFSGTGDVLDVLLYLYAAFAAYKIIHSKEERILMKRMLTLTLAVLMIALFTVFALGSGSSESVDQGSGDATPDSSANSVADCTVVIESCRLAKDWEGDPVVIVKYVFTNNSDDSQSFMLAFEDEVYQDGIGLNESYLLPEAANYSADNQTKEIKTGATLDVEVAYELNDTTTDVSVELSALFSFDDTTITKTFTIA